MDTKWIKVRIGLGGGLQTVLQFRRDIYEHHVADAAASGLRLDRYLAKKIWASGFADVIGDLNDTAVTHALAINEYQETCSN
jgi:hypothetical protein